MYSARHRTSPAPPRLPRTSTRCMPAVGVIRQDLVSLFLVSSLSILDRAQIVQICQGFGSARVGFTGEFG